MERIERIIGLVSWRGNAGLIAALVLALALKVALLIMNVVPFNADEAVVALMARHILQGERPLFFYGQAYLGSLDAWLIAGAFLLLGQSVLAIRIVQSVLYLGTIATTYALGLRTFGDRWTATVAALLMAMPTVLVTLYTTATLGGYGETLLLGNVLLLWAIWLKEKTSMANRGSAFQARPVADAIRSIADATRRGSFGEWALFGALAGIGFWGFGLLAAYLLPIGLALVFHHGDHRDHGDKTESELSVFSVFSVANHLSATIGFLLGSSPWWYATLFGGAETLNELGGLAISGASSAGLFGNIALHSLNLIVLGIPAIIGLRPPWAVRWLALPLAPLALAIFIGAVGRAVKLALVKSRGRSDDFSRPGQEAAEVATTNRDWRRVLLLGVCVTLIAAFILTPFGADPSGRYFLPLTAPLALFTADLLNRVRREYPRAAVALLGGLLVFNLWGNADSALRFPPGLTTQFDEAAQIDQRDLPTVIEFLLAHGETRGYSNYWVTFPMAFLSNEQLIYSAALPYHLDFRYTQRDDRYVPYTAAVAASDRAAYITTKHPALNAWLRSRFATLGVAFSETTIGDFHIFYGLSRKVNPEEIGLGLNYARER